MALREWTTHRRPWAPSTYALMFAAACAFTLLSGLAPSRTLAGVKNGGFEADGDWIVSGTGPLGTVAPRPEAQCKNTGNRGLRIGNDGAANGLVTSKVLQPFDCGPAAPGQKFCTVSFSAKYDGAGGERALVVLSNATDLSGKRIPVTDKFAPYKLSIKDCKESSLAFAIGNANLQKGAASRLCVDDVTCECTKEDETRNGGLLAAALSPSFFDTVPASGYKCYEAKDHNTPRFTPESVAVVDALGSEMIDVKKAAFVCEPVESEGSLLAMPLTCYQIDGPSLSPRPSVEVDTEFQTSQLELKKPKLLCVPSLRTFLP
jgi:hypothetical protein